jgi:hypothetical protein
MAPITESGAGGAGSAVRPTADTEYGDDEAITSEPPEERAARRGDAAGHAQ